jgi:hypothetical protein
MTLNRNVRHLLLALIAACILPASSRAATIISQTYSGSFPASISGTLPNQNTALELTFTVASMSSVTIYTTSYATGGFQPNLILFDAAGNYVAGPVAPGTSPVAKTDPASGAALDGYLTQSGLSAGQYVLALTDWELNQSPTTTNLSDGFTANYGNGVTFVDQGQNTRTGNYSVAIQLNQTPEPASFLLVLPGVAVLAGGLYRRRLAQKTQSV